jgi:hypothetical protein
MWREIWILYIKFGGQFRHINKAAIANANAWWQQQWAEHSDRQVIFTAPHHVHLHSILYYSQNILFLGKGSYQIGSVASIRTSPGRALCLVPCKQLRRVCCWWRCEVIWCRAMHWAWRLLPAALFFRVTKILTLCLWFCESLRWFTIDWTVDF